ncbi:hypothetical protein ACFCY8_11255 [Streptomyces noursei]|uniref:hypothetical protein n=1 Tax=Streptomyces noursei TaxID=1971 RepID=UPI0035D90934
MPALADEPGRPDRLGEGDVAAARALFTAGEYGRLHQVLPLPLALARGRGGGAAGVWVLASQLAVKEGDLEAAGGFAGRAGAAARRSGRPVVLAAAARAAATPLRRAGRAGQALRLLGEAHEHLTAGPTRPRPSPARC